MLVCHKQFFFFVTEGNSGCIKQEEHVVSPRPKRQRLGKEIFPYTLFKGIVCPTLRVWHNNGEFANVW